MKTFLKANTASLSASFCDYMLTILLVRFFWVDKLPAAIAGTIFGGLVNFLIGRYWAFNTQCVAISLQSKRYLLVWIGNLILNSSGFYMMNTIFKVQYIIAKVTTSLFVSLVYNYPLQRWYVFKSS